MIDKTLPPQLYPCFDSTDKTLHVYLCEDNPEGILSGIYDAWTSRYGHSHNYIQINSDINCNMFYEYFEVTTDIEKADSITHSIRTNISSQFYYFVESCLLSNDKSRADDIYRLLILAFCVGSSASRYLSYPFVQRLCKLEKNVWNETHHYMGFIRFEELKGGTLFARFRPHNNIITKLIPHFADRFPNENLIIIDMNRQIIALCRQGKIAFIINPDIDLTQINIELSDNEQLMNSLWSSFIDSITIKERSNIKLQKQLMPLRYREFMKEL